MSVGTRRTRVRLMRRARSRIRDILLAVAVSVLQLALALLGDGRISLADGVVALLALTLIARRQAPVLVLCALAVSSLGGLVAGADVPYVAYLVAVYTCARAWRLTPAIVVSATVMIMTPLVLVAFRGASTTTALEASQTLLPLAWLVASLAAGVAVREAEQRAEEAERTREETARRRAGEERLRVARDLHDSLTHQISVITLHSDVAVRTAERSGAPASSSILAIRDAARRASVELRSALTALRDEHPSGLSELPHLVSQVRSAGVDVELVVAGDAGTVPPDVDDAAYRIVQEALTNVTRHAAATAASIWIGYEPEAVMIRVEDNGHGRTDAAGSHEGMGLIGMRERVDTLGGSFRTGRGGAGGGFVVEATLPLRS